MVCAKCGKELRLPPKDYMISDVDCDATLCFAHKIEFYSLASSICKKYAEEHQNLRLMEREERTELLRKFISMAREGDIS